MRWDPFVSREELLIKVRLSLAGKLRGAEELCSPLGREEGFQGLRWARKQVGLR